MVEKSTLEIAFKTLNMICDVLHSPWNGGAIVSPENSVTRVAFDDESMRSSPRGRKV